MHLDLSGDGHSQNPSIYKLLIHINFESCAVKSNSTHRIRKFPSCMGPRWRPQQNRRVIRGGLNHAHNYP